MKGRGKEKSLVRSPLGTFIVERMEQVGLTRYKDLSELCGCKDSTLRQICRGGCHTSPALARKIAQALAVPEDEFLALVESSRREFGRRIASGEIRRRSAHQRFNISLPDPIARKVRDEADRKGKSYSSVAAVHIALSYRHQEQAHAAS